jgi:recombination protein RecA
MAGKKRTEGVVGAGADALAETLKQNLEDIGMETFTIGAEDTPTDLGDWISTGSSLLDLAISNRPNGGIPVGRIVELSGLEGSGKSLVAAHLIANVQKEGGYAVFIDTESAVNEDFWKSVGVDMSKLMYIPDNCLERVFEGVEKIVEKVRASDKKRKCIIVIDSIANLSTKQELEGSFSKEGYGTQKAYLLSQAMRKLVLMLSQQKILLVLTNQLRMNLQPMSHEKWITPGGKAIPFLASLRIRLTQAKKITKTDGTVVGVKVNAKVIKNRFGPPHREVTMDVYFDRGIDDVASWIEFMKKHKLVNDRGAGNYTYVDTNGEEFKFKSSTFKEWSKNNPTQFTEMYQKICDTLVMMYKTDGMSTVDGSALVEEETTSED